MSAIARIESDAPRGLTRSDNTISDVQWWQMAKEQAKVLVGTGFLPSSIKTPEQAMAIMLKGKELGIPTMYALSNIVMVQGKPSCSSELMVALVKRDYGRDALWVQETTNEKCVVAWRQNGSVQTLAFTAEDAKKATLWGKAGPWVQYPATMLRWRALSMVCKFAFADSIAGMYTPEELGANISVRDDGTFDVIETSSPPNVTSLRGRLAEKPFDPEPEVQAVEVIDEATGEILTPPAESASPADDALARETANRRMFATAKNKLDNHQMTIVARAAYGVTSRTQLTTDQLTALANAFEALPISHINALVEISDVLVNDPATSERPLTAEDMPLVAATIKDANFPQEVKDILRAAYKLTETKLKEAS